MLSASKLASRHLTVPPSPPPSPERIALADAIAIRNERRDQIAATRLAHATAEEAVYAARTRLEAAKPAVDEALTANTEHLVSVAAGRPGVPPPSIREARNRLVDAEDELAAAVAAREALKGELARVDGHDYAKEHVARAAGAVLAASPAVAALVVRIEAIQREAFDIGQALKFLDRNHALPRGEPVNGFKTLSPAEFARERTERPQSSWSDLAADATIAGAKPWEAILAALMDDANTEIPT